MNRRGGVAALMALAMATFVYLAYVSGVGNMYLPSESVASTTSSPVGRVAIPARIANPSPLAPAPFVDESPEPAPEPRAGPPPTSPAVVRDDRKDEGRKLPMECPTVDVADPENVAAVARSLGDASDVVVFATQDIEHWRAEFLVNVILNLMSVNVTSVVTVGRHKHTCETARRDNRRRPMLRLQHVARRPRRAQTVDLGRGPRVRPVADPVQVRAGHHARR